MESSILENFAAFSHFALHPTDTLSTSSFYHNYHAERYGSAAAGKLVPILTEIDRTELFRDIPSPDYFAYKPTYGRLNDKQRQTKSDLIDVIDDCLENESEERFLSNLKWLRANLQFALLLEEVGSRITPAWQLRDDVLTGKAARGADDLERFGRAREAFDEAPIREMFEVFAQRVRSRGELGALSSLNQRLWGEYQLLDTFLRDGLEAAGQRE